MTTRMTEGARQEMRVFFSGCCPRFSCLAGHANAQALPSQNLKKKRLLEIIIFLKVLEVMNSKHKLR